MSSTMHPRQRSRPLPAQWAMDDPADPLTGRLTAAHGLLDAQPLAAAREAEAIFPGVRDHRDLVPWLALVTAINGRIQTLSDFHPLDPLIDFYDERRPTLSAPASVQDQIDCALFGALVFRRPDHPSLPTLAERCRAIFEEHTDEDSLVRLSAANYLMTHRIWTGDLVGADALRARMAALHENTPDIHSRLMCHSMSSMILRLYLRYAPCRTEIRQGLALARASGIHSWDSHFHMQGAMLALSRENPAEARAWLDPMAELAPPEHYLDRAGYHYCLAWLHSLEEDMPLAIRHAEEAVTQTARSGAVFPQAVTHVGLGQLYLEQREVRAGLRQFFQARRIGRRMSSGQPLHFIRGLLTAHLAYRMGLRRRGDKALHQALAIGRRQHYLNFPWWRGDLVARLCVRALEADIEPDYVRTLIRARRLKLPVDAPAPVNWYWPVEINVLGTHRVLLDGDDPELSPQLLSLLLALACLADREGWVSRDRLVDELWPDSDGDQGQRALDTAIHRLRKQLGIEHLIHVRPGRVGLDARLCRVDYRSLLRTLEKDTDTSPEDVDHLLDIIERLENGSSNAWLPPRDNLQRRIAARVLSLVEGSLHDADNVPLWLETLVTYLPASEYVWQALIRHHLRHGMHGDALDVWERCREALHDHPGVEPSPATRALLQEIPAMRAARR